MAPKYKLTYFPLTALGEPIRFLLSYGNREFEDYRFDRSDWPKIKPTTSFGKARGKLLSWENHRKYHEECTTNDVAWINSGLIMDVDSKRLREGAKMVPAFGVATEPPPPPNAPLKNYSTTRTEFTSIALTDKKCSQLGLLFENKSLSGFMDERELANYFYDENEATKAPKLAPLQQETVPFFLSRFDKMVKENGGHFVGGQLKSSHYLMKMAETDFFTDYPNLKGLKEKVTNIPQISKWLKTRPSDVWA